LLAPWLILAAAIRREVPPPFHVPIMRWHAPKRTAETASGIGSSAGVACDLGAAQDRAATVCDETLAARRRAKE